MLRCLLEQQAFIEDQNNQLAQQRQQIEGLKAALAHQPTQISPSRPSQSDQAKRTEEHVARDFHERQNAPYRTYDV